MRKKSFILLSLICIFILVIPFHGFSMYVGNYSEQSFNEGEPDKSTGSKSSIASSFTIKYLIIKSATYFFKGKSKIDLLASRLEAADIDGVNFYELQQIVNDALCNMKTARYYYQALKNKADNTPYNQTVINQLTVFDYDSFSVEIGLNGDIFDQVKGYLKMGNVRGTYARLYDYTDNIIDMLETVQKEAYCWQIPDIENVWKLHQECAHMLLFGQYIAQIFQNLLG
jgi:hypothetical protein